MSHAPRLIVLGRDGILNVYREDHVKEPHEWQPIPGALEAVARLNQHGWHVVVATNQSGIGRGLFDMASLNAVHAHMMKLLAAQGGRIDAVFFCPHAPEESCDCRKPLPGMLHDIARRYGVDLRHVPLVGDTLRDLLAAQAAGCEPHLVLSGRAAALGDAELAQIVAQVPTARVHADLAAFADDLLRREHPRAADSVPGELR
ncbi:D-glycero-beta-D-manno-heptose 1,7-bisphosphate 7-phosphatase [Calidifontimicrobium sp. SYSU G02091]|uniref:D-glycero-beta-D-manno-heptose 1,7-bisphosphate 7-phosphatase n=1 Tax=Calidifontimicrobium sp. SYSU G02091 TaxID=2926421 RepID=UPI001F53A336|nr:D-glycero-beta-D-manno-heptose 1,7-bisphosphate 7-phosphatase [Calidifontimicrobium sp. SYSU G02091]MCI1190586.1 D-glycero-beta-D-manno-heptose 1,7-bisphosphate 7-phosphatase [Calidifontimicrobium sp. SYSU G02091]